MLMYGALNGIGGGGGGVLNFVAIYGGAAQLGVFFWNIRYRPGYLFPKF